MSFWRMYGLYNIPYPEVPANGNLVGTYGASVSMIGTKRLPKMSERIEAFTWGMGRKISK